MDDLLKKAQEIAGDVGEKSKDIFEDLAKEGKDVIDKLKDLLDGDDEEKPAEPGEPPATKPE